MSCVLGGSPDPSHAIASKRSNEARRRTVVHASVDVSETTVTGASYPTGRSDALGVREAVDEELPQLVAVGDVVADG